MVTGLRDGLSVFKLVGSEKGNSIVHSWMNIDGGNSMFLNIILKCNRRMAKQLFFHSTEHVRVSAFPESHPGLITSFKRTKG